MNTSARPATGGIGPALLITLGALTMLGPLGTDAFLPALPTLSHELQAGNGQAQLSLTGFTSGMAVGQLLAGPLSDGVGRRPLLVGGSLAVVLAALLAALAPSLIVLVAACVVMGLGASFGIVVARAVLSDLADGPVLTRAYALLGMLTGLGPVLGPAVGVVVMSVWGWRAIFVVMGLLAALCLVAVLWVVPESLPEHRRIPRSLRALPRNALAALRTRTYLRGATVTWFAFAGLFAYIAASAFLIQSVLGLSAIAYAVVFGLNGCGLIAASLLTARMSRRWAAQHVMAIGLGVEATGAAVVLVTALTGSVSAATLLPGLFLIACSMGFLFGPATSYALHGQRHVAGTALAVLGAVQFLAAGLVAPLVELGGDEDPIPFAIVVTACVAMAWVCWIVFREKSGRASREDVRHRIGVPKTERERYGQA